MVSFEGQEALHAAPIIDTSSSASSPRDTPAEPSSPDIISLSSTCESPRVNDDEEHWADLLGGLGIPTEMQHEIREEVSHAKPKEDNREHAGETAKVENEEDAQRHKETETPHQQPTPASILNANTHVRALQVQLAAVSSCLTDLFPTPGNPESRQSPIDCLIEDPLSMQIKVLQSRLDSAERTISQLREENSTLVKALDLLNIRSDKPSVPEDWSVPATRTGENAPHYGNVGVRPTYPSWPNSSHKVTGGIDPAIIASFATELISGTNSPETIGVFLLDLAENKDVSLVVEKEKEREKLSLAERMRNLEGVFDVTLGRMEDIEKHLKEKKNTGPTVVRGFDINDSSVAMFEGEPVKAEIAVERANIKDKL